MHGISNQLWLMEPERLLFFFDRLSQMKAWPSPEDIAKTRQAAAGNMRSVKGKVGVLAIHGVVEQRCSYMSYAYGGGFSTEDGEAALAALLADASVEAIICHVDSPGGTIYGVEEFANRLYEARQVKPIYSVSDSMAASAAYWLASSCTQMLCTPGGDVGSIGVYLMHEDWSKALDDAGVKVTIAKAGKYKAELNSYEPLSQDAKDYMQEIVDSAYTKFVRAVARNRDVTPATVRDTFGQGRLLQADDALKLGMIDKVMSFTEMLEKVTGSKMLPRETRRYGMELLREQHEARKSCGPVAGPGLTHDSKTSDKEPDWGSVDRTKLPRVAFADKGEDGKKSTWKYPHHWISGGKMGDDGVYVDGTLYLHRGGLNAAWSAAQGGRSGEKASEAVIAHLQRHRKALGLDKDD